MVGATSSEVLSGRLRVGYPVVMSGCCRDWWMEAFYLKTTRELKRKNVRWGQKGPRLLTCHTHPPLKKKHPLSLCWTDTVQMYIPGRTRGNTQARLCRLYKSKANTASNQLDRRQNSSQPSKLSQKAEHAANFQLWLLCLRPFEHCLEADQCDRDCQPSLYSKYPCILIYKWQKKANSVLLSPTGKWFKEYN